MGFVVGIIAVFVLFSLVGALFRAMMRALLGGLLILALLASAAGDCNGAEAAPQTQSQTTPVHSTAGPLN